MKNILNKLIWLALAVPAIYLAIVWNSLPEKVAMHYNLQGEVDRYGNKTELIGMVVILSVVSLFVYFLLTNIHRIDPKKYAPDNKERLRPIIYAVVIFLSAINCMIIYTSSRPNIKFGTGMMLAGVGLLFAIIGNYMPRLKPNYFAGIRVPWTLENPDNWKKTHQLAGKLWFAGGLLLAVVCLFLPPAPSIILFFIIAGLISIIPCIYSYRLFRQQKAGNRVE